MLQRDEDGLARVVLFDRPRDNCRSKIGMSPYASADVSRGLPFAKAEFSQETSSTDTVPLSSKIATAGTKLRNGPSTKADKLDVSYRDEIAPEVELVKSIAIVLPTTEPKRLSKKIERIASRHWHDPLSVSAELSLPLNAKCLTRAPTVPAWSVRMHQSLDRRLFG